MQNLCKNKRKEEKETFRLIQVKRKNGKTQVNRQRIITTNKCHK